MAIFQGEKIWRLLTNFWTFVFLIFIILNFYSGDRYGFLVTPLSILYIGILSLYVGTKEFDRWYEIHEGRHPGELFVIVWTAVILILIGISFFSGSEYRVPSEIAADYIAVLTIFAVTQKSKQMHRLKRRFKK